MNIETIKQSIEREDVSYEELAWLQSHPNEVIATGDATLCEWAGIDEDTFHKYQEAKGENQNVQTLHSK